MTDLRDLPDEELLVGDVLNDVPWSPITPPNLASKMPCRVIYKLGGTAVHPQFMDKPTIHIVSYAGTYDAAKALAETARVRLWNARRAQTRFEHGVIHRVVESLSPFHPRTGTEPDGVFRFDQTHQVWTRP